MFYKNLIFGELNMDKKIIRKKLTLKNKSEGIKFAYLHFDYINIQIH